MLIGILQTGHAAEAVRSAHGDYDAMFARLLAGRGLDFRTWNVVDMEFPEGPRAADGWLITGSKHAAYEDHAWIAPLEQHVRDAFAARVPVVGVCFGHQIVAQAMGGTVEKFAGGWAIGRTDYDWQGETLALNAWHQDQVTRPPEDASVLASDPFCVYAALGYGDRALTIQAHPEFDRGVMRGLLAHRGPGLVPDDTLAAAAMHLDKPTDAPRIADRIAAFLAEARHG